MVNRRTLLAAALLLFSACDAENVRWAFVSNPGGTFGPAGGGLVIVWTSSSSTVALTGDFLRVDGFDERGAVTVMLPHVGDFAVLSRNGSVEVRSPALAYDDASGNKPGRFQAVGATIDVPTTDGPAALLLHLPDTSVVHPGGVGPGTLHVAAAGTLMILESGAGLVVFGHQEQPEVVGLSATLTVTPAGDQYALRLLSGQLRYLPVPPLPLPEQRIQQVPSHDSLRLFGPVGEVLAEVPATSVSLEHGVGGVFLRAALPEGVPGDSGPMNLLMAASNRYLLRVNQ